MIWRLVAALRRLLRAMQDVNRSPFSAEWHRDQERASWQSAYQFPTWRADQVGKRAERVKE